MKTMKKHIISATLLLSSFFCFTQAQQRPVPIAPPDSLVQTYTGRLAHTLLNGTVKVGDEAGGDLTGTYPNPTIKESVHLSGTPTAETQPYGDSSESIATTAFVMGTLGDANMQSVTWAELKDLRDNAQLNKGRWYRITDYVTTVNSELTNAKSAGHPFDVVVLAMSERLISDEARAMRSRSRDEEGYFAGVNMEAWKVWYCIDNDLARFEWADTADGKGVIYRLVDEWRNEAPYDMKNIMFKRYKASGGYFDTAVSTNYPRFVLSEGMVWDGITKENDSTWFYTFTYNGEDATLSKAHDNILKPYWIEIEEAAKWPWLPDVLVHADCAFRLNDIVLTSTEDEFHGNTWGAGCHDMTFHESCYDNVFKSHCYNMFGSKFYKNQFQCNCYNNIFGIDCYSNTFKDDCQHNTFSSYCCYNTFSMFCHSNTFSSYCRYNTFSSSCFYNTFSSYCNYNTFSSYCQYNTFSSDCSYNTFSSSCYYNTFSGSCQYNTFSSNCQHNTFSSYCHNNTFSSGCYGNTFSSSCSYNTFSSYCQYNTFSSNCQYNTLLNDCQYVEFPNSCSKNTVYNGVNFVILNAANTTNTQILSGVHGTSKDNMLEINFERDVKYSQFAGLNSAGELKIWTPADLIP